MSKTFNISGKKLWDKDIADDLALTADTITKSTVPLHYLENAANDVGLDLNASTIKLMAVIHHGSLRLLSVESIKSDESFFHNVEEQ